MMIEKVDDDDDDDDDDETCCCVAVKVSIAWRSMNDGDVYILDAGQILYVWNGKSSSRTERIKVCTR